VIFTALVVVLALGTLASVSVATVRRSFPNLSGSLLVPGLKGPVDVFRDSYGVPHIYADNPEDLFEAQGYVQAQDRFYEMDFRRHVAAGRLAELYGASQVEVDAYIRTLSWRRAAEQELPLLSASTRRYLDAYAAGVNAYLRDKPAADLSLEYSLLGLQGLHYSPEDWTPVDSLSWLKVMAWNLASNIDQETELAIMGAKVGATRADELFPDYPINGFAPIVDQGTVRGKVFDPTASTVTPKSAPSGLGRDQHRATRLQSTGSSRSEPAVPSRDQYLGSAAKASPVPRSAAPGLSRDQLRRAVPELGRVAALDNRIHQLLGAASMPSELGSNSWAVTGAHTASGEAMLANDPHLATSIPSTFGQLGLHCRALSTGCPFDVSGFSLASVPGVVIGKNTKIAWGLTTSHLDVQDLYLEEVNGDTVRVGDQYQPLAVRTEELRVRGEQDPRLVRIRSSRHGPLLSDVSTSLQRLGASEVDPSKAPYAVSLSWVGLTPGRTMDALLAIDAATDFTSFRAAAKLLAAPSQNLIYADVVGNIGYQLPGDAPLRGLSDGRLPSPGWDSNYDWKQRIPFEQLPYAYNPPNGIIVAANQEVIGRQYPYPLGWDYSYGWRSQEIADILKEAPPLTADSAERIFYDDTIRVAAELVPMLLKIKIDDPWIREGQQTLVGWDYSADAGSAAAAFFAVAFHNILKMTFRDEMPEDLWPAGGDRWYAVVSQLIKQPRDRWWDDVTTKDKIETRDDILVAALVQARKEITSLMARDTGEWQWGTLHRVTLRNQTLGRSGIAPVEMLFNRGNYRLGGGPAVVDALGYDDRLGYHVESGPTMRMLVDLGDPDASRWVNQTGVSGHAFSQNYDDQTKLWAAGRTWPFVSSPDAVARRTVNRLHLAPGN
jgi:penicillin G amidase